MLLSPTVVLSSLDAFRLIIMYDDSPLLNRMTAGEKRQLIRINIFLIIYSNGRLVRRGLTMAVLKEVENTLASNVD